MRRFDTPSHNYDFRTESNSLKNCLESNVVSTIFTP